MAVNVILGTLSGMLYQFKFGFTWRIFCLKSPLKGRGLGSRVQPMGGKGFGGGEGKCYP